MSVFTAVLRECVPGLNGLSGRFEDFFNKYSNGKDGLTLSDLWEALKGQRVIMDPIGWFGAFFECEQCFLVLSECALTIV